MRCWPSLAVSDRADRDIPPFGCADSGGTQTDEAADAALSGRIDGAADDLPRLDGPQFRPQGIAERAKIADVQRLHAAGVHRQETAVEIEHLDAIQAALDQPRFECFAGPQRFFGSLMIRDRSKQSGLGITKFQLADRLPAEHTQGVFLFGRQLSRDAVEHADRSQGASVCRDERGTGVKPDVGVARDERIGRKARIGERVSHDEQVRVLDRGRAKRHVPRRFRDRQSDPGFEPLSVRVHEAHECHRRLADACGHEREVVEVLIRRRIEDVVAPERRQPVVFVVRGGRTHIRSPRGMATISLSNSSVSNRAG